MYLLPLAHLCWSFPLVKRWSSVILWASLQFETMENTFSQGWRKQTVNWQNEMQNRQNDPEEKKLWSVCNQTYLQINYNVNIRLHPSLCLSDPHMIRTMTPENMCHMTPTPPLPHGHYSSMHRDMYLKPEPMISQYPIGPATSGSGDMQQTQMLHQLLQHPQGQE